MCIVTRFVVLAAQPHTVAWQFQHSSTRAQSELHRPILDLLRDAWTHACVVFVMLPLPVQELPKPTTTQQLGHAAGSRAQLQWHHVRCGIPSGLRARRHPCVPQLSPSGCACDRWLCQACRYTAGEFKLHIQLRRGEERVIATHVPLTTTGCMAVHRWASACQAVAHTSQCQCRFRASVCRVGASTSGFVCTPSSR